MNNMTETKNEDPKSDVGSILRQKRMHRGSSLEAVHQQTRIPKRLLEALENNRVDAFPAPVYLRGFLKGYCDYLELDFEPLWKQLFPDAQGAEAPAPAPDLPQPASAPRPKEPSPGLPAMNQTALVPLALAGALVLAAGALWVFREKPKPAAPPVRPADPPAAISPIAPPSEPTLRLTALHDTWIRLKVDGVLRFEGRVPASSHQDWKARKDFSLRAASGADLRLVFDEKEAALSQFPLGADGFHQISR